MLDLRRTEGAGLQPFVDEAGPAGWSVKMRGRIRSMRHFLSLDRPASIPKPHAPPVPDLTPSLLAALHLVVAIQASHAASASGATAESAMLRTLFGEGATVNRAEAFRVLRALDLEALLESGMLCEQGGQVWAPLQVQHYGGLAFFSDFPRLHHTAGFVLPIGPAGRYLANLTIRQPARTALDLGCGCGIQALLASRHAEKVTATDINPRALALTRLNAALNAVTNIEVLEGSTFEPVERQTFDLIVANLPYVISPESRLAYRDADQPPGASVQRWIREIPAHLSEGGYGQALVNWVHAADEPWWQPVRQSTLGAQADVWLIYNGSKQPSAYADMWLDVDGGMGSRGRNKAKAHWLNWYRRRGIEQIGLGAITFRRRSSGPNWFRAGEVTTKLQDAAGEQIRRLFAMQDLFDSVVDPRELLKMGWVPQGYEIGPERTPGKCLVSASGGLRLRAEVDPVLVSVLGYMDGQTSLEEAIHRIDRDHGGESGVKDDVVLNDIGTLALLGMIVPRGA